MKKFVTSLVLAFSAAIVAKTQAIFINEFHYDNTGSDVGEFVEVAVQTTYAGLLSDIVIVLYNGANGDPYDTDDLSTATMGNTEDGFTFYYISYPSNGLQNGAPDGIALVVNGMVEEFLSYEGTFTADNGPANGTTSTDIGVSEDPPTSAGNSLQRTGTCDGSNCPTGLSWTGPAGESPGAKNTSEFLPVELVNFEAKLIDNTVALKWLTASEVNNSHFLVERATNGRDFSEIGQVLGNGTTFDFNSYDFTDLQPNIGTNYYRLRQVDFDGKHGYSPVETVTLHSAARSIAIFPTLSTDEIKFEPQEGLSGEKTLFIFDKLGRQVSSQQVVFEQGAIVSLPVLGLSKGIYFVMFQDGHQTYFGQFAKG